MLMMRVLKSILFFQIYVDWYKISVQDSRIKTGGLKAPPLLLALRSWLLGFFLFLFLIGSGFYRTWRSVFGRLPWHCFKRNLANKFPFKWFLESDKHELPPLQDVDRIMTNSPRLIYSKDKELTSSQPRWKFTQWKLHWRKSGSAKIVTFALHIWNYGVVGRLSLIVARTGGRMDCTVRGWGTSTEGSHDWCKEKTYRKRWR